MFMIIDAAVVNIPIPNSVLHRRVLSNAKKGLLTLWLQH